MFGEGDVNTDIPTFEGYEVYFPNNAYTKVAIYLNQIGHDKKYIFSNSWDDEVKGHYYCVEHPDDDDEGKIADFPWDKVRVVNAAKNNKCVFLLERNSELPVQFILKTEDGTSIHYGPTIFNIEDVVDLTKKYHPFSYVSTFDEEDETITYYHEVICNSPISSGGAYRKTRQRKTRQRKTRQRKTRQRKTRQRKTRQRKTRQRKTRQRKTRYARRHY